MTFSPRFFCCQEIRYNLRLVIDRVKTTLNDFGMDSTLPPSGIDGGETAAFYEEEKKTNDEELVTYEDKKHLRSVMNNLRATSAER